MLANKNSYEKALEDKGYSRDMIIDYMGYNKFGGPIACPEFAAELLRTGSDPEVIRDYCERIRPAAFVFAKCLLESGVDRSLIQSFCDWIKTQAEAEYAVALRKNGRNISDIEMYAEGIVDSKKAIQMLDGGTLPMDIRDACANDVWSNDVAGLQAMAHAYSMARDQERRSNESKSNQGSKCCIA